MSSAIVDAPLAKTSLYHVAKASLTALAMTLNIEFKGKIYFSAVQPTFINNTKFFFREGFKNVKFVEKSILSVPTEKVVTVALQRIGKQCIIKVGAGAWIAAAVGSLGRNIAVWVWKRMPVK